jgi:hypothetical protein
MLEVLIGLAIVFLTLSVFVAGIQEFIASLFQWRAKHLEASILQMMTRQLSRKQKSCKESDLANSLLSALYGNDLVQSMNHYSDAWLPRLWRSGVSMVSRRIASIIPKFKSNLPSEVNHETDGRSERTEKRPVSEPSHLEPEIFASAVVQEVVLQGIRVKQPSNGQASPEGVLQLPISQINFDDIRTSINTSDKIPDAFQKSLLTLVDKAESKSYSASSHLQEFQQEIEVMFDRSMQRATGVYKRNAQLVCFLIGLLSSILLNVNSVDLVSRFHRDNTLREALSNSAPQMLQNYKKKPEPNANFDEINLEQLEKDLGATMPIKPMISYDNDSHSLNVNPDFSDCTKDRITHSCIVPSESLGKLSISKLLVSFPGWFITAFAIYMGAPFWFEILGKLVQVRSIGKTSEEI